MRLNVVITPVLTLLLSLLCLFPNAYGQQMIPAGSAINNATPDVGNGAAIGSKPSSQASGALSNASQKQELMHQISVLEAAGKRAEGEQASDIEAGRIYAQLGLLYIDAAMWDRSEAELKHAVSLMRRGGSTGELATTLSTLGSLHATMGKLQDGEKEVLEAEKLREERGDRLEMARSWSDLATIYLAQHKFGKAREFAQEAADEFVANGKATPFDRIETRYSLSLALCAAKDYASAIPVLKAAVDEAVVALKPGDFSIGVGEFLLGYAYWKSGSMQEADEYMGRGTAQMSAQLGWGHPVYVYALKRYARFLRESRRGEEANAVELRIRQIEAVVDVQSLQARSTMGGFVGLP